MIKIRTSVLPDISRTVEDLRTADYEEIKALGADPFDALFHGHVHGECYTAEGKYGIICMFGVVPEGDAGRIWLIGTNCVFSNYFGFCRLSKEWLLRLRPRYRMLFNIADERNRVTIRWLQWLGFEFGNSFTIGPEGHKFKEFCLWQSVQP